MLGTAVGDEARVDLNGGAQALLAVIAERGGRLPAMHGEDGRRPSKVRKQRSGASEVLDPTSVPGLRVEGPPHVPRLHQGPSDHRGEQRP